MVRIFPDPQAYLEHVARLPSPAGDLEATVREILARVRDIGDSAVRDYSEQFDGIRPANLRVPVDDLERAVAYLDPALKDVWIQAIENIERFHQRQREDSRLEFFDDGTVLGWRVTPVERVGIYIPGGRAVYTSSLLMNVIPAKIAGVPRIVLTSPPSRDGLPHRDIMAAAALLDVNEVYAIGGAQAIGALAYGTESVPHVLKITGPGNRWVAEAKRQVYGVVGIDSVAGPSEILILCDIQTKPEYLVRDLLAQAEHDTDARALLITTDRAQAETVAERLRELIPTLPRKEIIRASFDGASGIVLVDDVAQGIEMVNEIAPEHLEILTPDPFTTLNHIRNAGAIFLGEHTPEPVGDYFAGPNHVIPTGGRAKFSSPLGVWDFVKRSTVTRYSAERLARDGDAICLFAEREELFAHAEAVRARMPAKAPVAAAASAKRN